ncbi:terminase large subunit [Clostridium botulinum]|uniref:terminase large subunit n=1 Tax=Clostridium botulinum TaxID=1491 RepID=UPI0006A6C7F9|nr:terminase TerL endonuclease subunit [Clostridium botulinum]KAI3350139.1 terminase large subunit [Clostridium botulinum]
MITYSCIEETKAYWYAWNVVEGNIIACEDVFNSCNRFLKDVERYEEDDFPYYFDLDIMARIENVASCFKFTSGARAGEKIDLAPPQSFILGNIYGWRFKNNKKKRRFRFVFLMISRKNSKSFLIALISLMAMMDEQENETYSFAGKKEQARICFEQAKALIRSNPKVARKFKLNKLEIVLKKNNSKFQPLASEEKTLDGTSPSTGIIDEAYIVPVGVKNSVSSGTGARLSPLIVCITTSYDVPSVGNWAWEDMQYTKKINVGIAENERHFGMIYSLDDEKEVDKPELWEKANPLIPYSPVLMEDLHEAYKRTKLSPAELRNFKIKRMNLILDGVGIDKYLHLPSWRENMVESIDFNKRYVFYGVDLSITTDLSAVAKCIYDPYTDTFEIEVHGFAPQENIHELEVRDGIPYRQYADEGYITLCPGRVIDQDFIIEWILKEQNQDYIAMVGYDPYNSDYMLNRLDELGINTFEIRQGYRMLSGPTKLFREYVYKHKIKYKKNPILEWCVSNAITTKDKFQNEILDKVKSENKIDLLAAAIFSFLMCDMEKWNYVDKVYDDDYIV